jgi:hypothetical protein
VNVMRAMVKPPTPLRAALTRIRAPMAECTSPPAGQGAGGALREGVGHVDVGCRQHVACGSPQGGSPTPTCGRQLAQGQANLLVDQGHGDAEVHQPGKVGQLLQTSRIVQHAAGRADRCPRRRARRCARASCRLAQARSPVRRSSRSIARTAFSVVQRRGWQTRLLLGLPAHPHGLT